jgi:DNA repair protein SbcD/Mre11
MARFCFVQAADLHLDTPFACARAESPTIAETLREATFRAWQRIVEISVENGAAFVVVAGDIYDASQKSLRAQLRFREGLERLSKKGIQAFVTHGNHDPLDSVSASVPPPSNTCVFGAEVETREVWRDGQILTRITESAIPRRTNHEIWLAFSRLPKRTMGKSSNLQFSTAMSAQRPAMNPTLRVH